MNSHDWGRARQDERSVSTWLQSQGFVIVSPATIDSGNAPTLSEADSRWATVRTKSRATRNQALKRWEHGIAVDQWTRYLAFEDKAGIPGWLAILELESGIVLLKSLAALDRIKRLYLGSSMPGGAPHVFFPRDDFDFHSGPTELTFGPAPAVAARTLKQPPAPTTKQLGFELPDVRLAPNWHP